MQIKFVSFVQIILLKQQIISMKLNRLENLCPCHNSPLMLHSKNDPCSEYIDKFRIRCCERTVFHALKNQCIKKYVPVRTCFLKESHSYHNHENIKQTC